MKEISEDYPHNYSKKEIKGIIASLSKDIMPTSHVGSTSQAGANRLLKLGKIQLGINELQSRQSKRIIVFTIIVSLISLMISLSALMISINSNKSTQDIELLKLDQNKKILNEMKSLKEAIIENEKNEAIIDASKTNK